MYNLYQALFDKRWHFLFLEVFLSIVNCMSEHFIFIGNSEALIATSWVTLVGCWLLLLQEIWGERIQSFISDENMVSFFLIPYYLLDSVDLLNASNNFNLGWINDH